jgi:hypothetical protein
MLIGFFEGIDSERARTEASVPERASTSQLEPGEGGLGSPWRSS